MPKGYIVEGGYATVSKEYQGHDYRTISEIMTCAGHKMNHATARNRFLKVMEKFASRICAENGGNGNVDDIARNPQFQAGICEIIQGLDADE